MPNPPRPNSDPNPDPGSDPDPDPDACPKRKLALDVVRRLRANGHQAVWAGGCVRDMLLGATPEDYDVATDAAPERVRRLFPHTIPVGISFGVVRVIGPRAGGEIEVATFRSDGAYTDGRRPDSVTFGCPREDAKRRDFTINGMFYDPVADEVLDYVGGRADLENRYLRAIGDPEARFREDKLRLVRAVRFAARLAMTIEPETRAAIQRMAPQIRVVAPERIAQELRKMLVHPRRAEAARLLRETGLLRALFPRLDELSEDDWNGVLRALAALPGTVEFPVALAALFASLGPEAVERVADELRLSNQERDDAVWLVAHREALRDAAGQSLSKLKRLLASPRIESLLELREALDAAEGRPSIDAAHARAQLRDEPNGPINPPPLLSGADLIAAGYPPGPLFARILDRVRDEQLENRLATREEALALVAREHPRPGSAPPL